MTNQDLRELEVDVEYHFTDGNYQNRLKIGLDKKNKRVYCVQPQFGHSKILLTPRKKSVYYCKTSISVGGLFFSEEWFDIEKWSVTKIDKEIYKDYLKLWSERIDCPDGIGTQCKHPYAIRKKYGRIVSRFKEDHGNGGMITEDEPYSEEEFKEILFNDDEFRKTLATVLKL